MIAEAAYYLAQKRAFQGRHELDDWLAAEQLVREAISPVLDSEVDMSNHGRNAVQNPGPSRFERFAATQAAGDGIEGDVRKAGKTPGEKLGANMADRK